MALAYLTNLACSRCSTTYKKTSGKVSLIYLFIASIIPDLDIVFYNYVQHHTITHSITFWGVVYLPLFIRWRKKVIPYFVATLSHLVGDFLMGKPPIFYGIVDTKFGLSLDYMLANMSQDWFLFFRALLDFSTVIVFVLLLLKDRPLKLIFQSDKDAFIGLPILGGVVSAIFIATSIQEKLFSLQGTHDWPIFIAGYAMLAAAHVLVMLTVIRHARKYAAEKESQVVAK